MQIECPACNKGNNLNLEQIVRCGHCQVTLTGNTYKKTKGIMGAVVAALFAGAVGHNALTSNDRYSIDLEYDLIHACANGSQVAQTRFAYELKKEDCICALRAVQPDFKSSDINNNTQQFLTVFGNRASTCRSSRTG